MGRVRARPRNRMPKRLRRTGSANRLRCTRRSIHLRPWPALSTWRCSISSERRAARRSIASWAGRRATRSAPLPIRMRRRSAPSRSRCQSRHRATRARPIRTRCRRSSNNCRKIATSCSARNGSLTPGDAASVAAAVESSHPLWFDEPCSVSNVEAVRKVSGETVTPLGFGRGIGDAGVFQALLREGLDRRGAAGYCALGHQRRAAHRRTGGGLLRGHRAPPRRRTGGYRGGNPPGGERAQFLHPARAAAGTIRRIAKCALRLSPAASKRHATVSCSFQPVRVSAFR